MNIMDREKVNSMNKFEYNGQKVNNRKKFE